MQVVGNDVEVVEPFTYLGTQISKDSSCEAEISRRIAITRDRGRALQRHIWCSSITVATKVWLLNAYVLPVLLYGAETWSLTAALKKKLDAFHLWCLRWLFRLSYLCHVTNVEVLHLTCQAQLSTTLQDRRLHLFWSYCGKITLSERHHISTQTFCYGLILWLWWTFASTFASK